MSSIMREDWIECTFGDLLDYEQPTKYIVKSTKYSDDYKTPVLTAGKSFIKGYTNETTGIFNDLPTIIFDDFTTATQFVDFEFKVKSSAMKILVPTSKLVNMKFVFNCIQVNQVRNDTHKRYWISVYAKKKILLPPLVMQNAILAKTEEIFSDLDNGIANFKKAQEQLKIYRQAVLKKAFEGELTKEWREKRALSGVEVPTAKELLKQIKEERQNHYNQQIEDWKKAVKKWEENGKDGKKPSKPTESKELPPLRDEELKELSKLHDYGVYVKMGILSDVVRGGSPRPAGDERYYNGDIPFLKVADLTRSTSKYVNSYTYTIKEAGLHKTRLLETGTLVISNSGATLGVPRILAIQATANDGIAAFLGLNKLRIDYLYHYWDSKTLALRAIDQGAGQPNLNTDLLKNYPVPIFSILEQNQIVQEIESRLSVCDKVEQSITESLEKAEALRQSILKKAFEGRLLSEAEVTACKQAVDYEPASELLKKIKADKLAKEQALRQAKDDKKKKSTTKKKSEK
jgi:type I restriction enzyme, S subunit